MLWRWRRINQENRQQLWRLYGYFTAITCFGSCAGAASWAANNQLLAMYFARIDSGVKNSDTYHMHAIEKRWSAAFYFLYPLEILSLCAAKLMILNRLFAFAIPEVDSQLRRLCMKLAMILLCVVTAGNFVGFCANIAAAAYQLQASDSLLDAAAAFSRADLITVDKCNAQSQSNGQLSQVANSVQQFSEMVVLLLIVAAFALSGALCAVRIRLATRRLRDFALSSSPVIPSAATRIQRQIYGTAAFVFVTFTLRAVFSTLYAAAAAGARSQPECPTCSPQCNNTYSLILTWLNFTPEFQLFVVLISSPLAAAVSLWGMTSDRVLEASRALQGAGAGAAQELFSKHSAPSSRLNPPSPVVRE